MDETEAEGGDQIEENQDEDTDFSGIEFYSPSPDPTCDDTENPVIEEDNMHNGDFTEQDMDEFSEVIEDLDEILLRFDKKRGKEGKNQIQHQKREVCGIGKEACPSKVAEVLPNICKDDTFDSEKTVDFQDDLNDSSSSQVIISLEDLRKKMKNCFVLLDRSEVDNYLSANSKSITTPDASNHDTPGNNFKAKVKSKMSPIPVYCNVCKLKFTSKVSLRRHNARKHNAEPLCKYCGEFYALLHAHEDICVNKSLKKQQVHTKVESKTGKIPFVHQSSHSEMELKNALVPVTNQNSDFKVGLVDIPTSSDQDNKICYCKICPLQFATFKGLRRHQAKKHGTEPTCKYCDEFFVFLPDHEALCARKANSKKKLQKGKKKSKKAKSLNTSSSNTKSSLNTEVLDCHDSAQTEQCNMIIKSEKNTTIVNSEVESVKIETKIFKPPLMKWRYSCHICKKSFPIPASLKKHIALRHRFTVTKSQKSEGSFKLKLKFASPSSSNLKVKCDICGARVRYLQLHKASVHYTEPFCHRCKKCFDSVDVLETHLDICMKQYKKIDNQVKNIPCEICGCKFYTNFLLRLHKAIEHVTEPVCVECNIFFKDYDELTNHTSANHHLKSRRSSSIIDDMPTLKSILDSSFDRFFQAAIQNTNREVKEFTVEKSSRAGPVKNDSAVVDVNNVKVNKIGNLIENVIAKEYNNNPSSVEQIQKFSCSQCNKSFTLKRSLSIHMSKYHKNKRNPKKQAFCKICKLETTSLFNLCVHMNRTHKLSTIYCSVCKVLFMTPIEFQSHKPVCGQNATVSHLPSKNVQSTYMHDIASSSKEFCCPLCLKNFTSEFMLDMHMKFYHKIIQGYESCICKTCGKCFNTAIELDNHVKKDHQANTISSAVKKQPAAVSTVSLKKFCTICNAYFSQFRKHNAYKHNSEPYCGRCSKFFGSFEFLEKHIETCYTELGKKRRLTRLKRVREEGKKETFEYVMMDNGTSSASDYFHKLICRYCSLSFDSKNTLENHIIKEHQNLDVSCVKHSDNNETVEMEVDNANSVSIQEPHEVNGLEFVAVKELLNDNAEVCNVCSQTFPSSIDLKIHVNSQHNGNYFLCHPCKIEFVNITDFVTHIHSCEKSKEVQHVSKTPTSPPVVNSIPVVKNVMHIKQENFELM